MLVAAMTALHTQYQGAKARPGAQVKPLPLLSNPHIEPFVQVDRLREQARSLITYAGMIPYRSVLMERLG